MSHITDQRSYTISGMTCAHCVASVCEEVAEVDGVQSVDVDLASGQMVVTGQTIDDSDIRSAVSEAGYQIAA